MIFISKSKFIILAAIGILFVGASWVIKVANSSHNIPIIKEIPNFSFTDQDGEEFDNRAFENKITILVSAVVSLSVSTSFNIGGVLPPSAISL